MKKRSFALILLIVCSCFWLAGCQKSGSSKNDTAKTKKQEATGQKQGGLVELKVWADEADREIISKMCEKFASSHKGEASFKFIVQPVPVTECRSKLLTNIMNASDIYTTTDDELLRIVSGGAASEVDGSKVKSENSELSVASATVNNKIYGYPLLNNKESVLYYNKRYLKASDIKTVDGILTGSAKKNKKFAMNLSSGIYLYSFYGQTGLNVSLQADGLTTSCLWNSKNNQVKGTDVAKAVMNIGKNKAFINASNISDIAKNGNVAAFVGDISFEVQAKKAWGDNFGVASLPTYTCAGKQLQMASFTGYNLLCVNPYSNNLEWAHKLAAYLSSENNQLLMYGNHGSLPSNKNAAKAEDVLSSQVIQAVLKQQEYSQLYRVGQNYINAVPSFGKRLAEGKIKENELQNVLDGFVMEVTEKVK